MVSFECQDILGSLLPGVRTMLTVHTEFAALSTVHVDFAAFNKSMKRDAGLYPVITQDAQWDNWNCSLVAIARAQAVDQVLDPTYLPVLPDDIALFAEKQKYM
jgi:hypothetical protein